MDHFAHVIEQQSTLTLYIVHDLEGCVYARTSCEDDHDQLGEDLQKLVDHDSIDGFSGNEPAVAAMWKYVDRNLIGVNLVAGVFEDAHGEGRVWTAEERTLGAVGRFALPYRANCE